MSLAEVLLLNNQHLLEKAGGGRYKSLLGLADTILVSYDVGRVLEVNISLPQVPSGGRGAGARQALLGSLGFI